MRVNLRYAMLISASIAVCSVAVTVALEGYNYFAHQTPYCTLAIGHMNGLWTEREETAEGVIISISDRPFESQK